MPAVSKKQQKYFGYLLSNPEERKKKGISKKAAKDFARDVAEQEVHWYKNDGSKPTPRRKALNRADEFDNRGQNDRAAKIRRIVISKDHGDDYEARRKAKSIKVDDKKVGKLPVASIDDKRGAVSGDVQKKLKAKKLSEVSPPGWGHTKAEKEKTKPWKPKSKIGGTAAAFKRALDDGRFKGLPGSTTKKEKTADMFKLMWSMKKKGDKPHYKPGTDEKKKKYQKESLSVKDSKKLNKAAVLDQSKDPKDWESARARRTEIDYKDLVRQMKKKKMKEDIEYTYPNVRRNPRFSTGSKMSMTPATGIGAKKSTKNNPAGDDIRNATYNQIKKLERKKAAQKRKTASRIVGIKKMRNEATTMKDNNLFGNAYAGNKEWKKKNKKAMAHRYKTLHKGDAGGDVNEKTEYEKLKKKIGSKKKHDKPAMCEGISYKDFMNNVY